jgi:hypothetical protein
MDRREVCTVPPDIAGKDWNVENARLGADKKIGQDTRSGSSGQPIATEGLSGKE